MTFWINELDVSIGCFTCKYNGIVRGGHWRFIFIHRHTLSLYAHRGTRCLYSVCFVQIPMSTLYMYGNVLKVSIILHKSEYHHNDFIPQTCVCTVYTAPTNKVRIADHHILVRPITKCQDDRKRSWKSFRFTYDTTKIS